MSDLNARLKDRALRALANPSVVTDEDIAAAVTEANDLCDGRKVTDTARLDIAYFRLRLRLKCEITELDNELYRQALELVNRSPMESGGATYNGVAKVAGRENRWE